VRDVRRPQPVLGSWRHPRGGPTNGFSLQERADERAAGFVALVAATGIAKLVGAIVPLWLVFGPPSRSVRNLLLFLCWAGGALLALHGLNDVVTGSIGAARDTTENAIWYAVPWGPTWLLGGLLFLMTAWASTQRGRAPGR
jgi:hypothetical protein